ncbi:MAG: hypothetical protein ACRYGC_12310 [Janthinobacterium lividum]
MAFKVNYGLQKAERTRAKQAKKESKLREREAAAASGGSSASEEPAAEGDAEHAEPAAAATPTE